MKSLFLNSTVSEADDNNSQPNNTNKILSVESNKTDMQKNLSHGINNTHVGTDSSESKSKEVDPELKKKQVKNEKRNIKKEYKDIMDDMFAAEQAILHVHTSNNSNVVSNLSYSVDKGGFVLDDEFLNSLKDNEKSFLDKNLNSFNTAYHRFIADILIGHLNVKPSLISVKEEKNKEPIEISESDNTVPEFKKKLDPHKVNKQVPEFNSKSNEDSDNTSQQPEKKVRKKYQSVLKYCVKLKKQGNAKQLLVLTQFPLSPSIKQLNLFESNERLNFNFGLLDEFMKCYSYEHQQFIVNNKNLTVSESASMYLDLVTSSGLPVAIPLSENGVLLNTYYVNLCESEKENGIDDVIIDGYHDFKYSGLSELSNVNEDTTSADIAVHPAYFGLMLPMVSFKPANSNKKLKIALDILKEEKVNEGIADSTVETNSTEVTKVDANIKGDFVDKSNREYFLKTNDTTLARYFNIKWEVPIVDPGEMSILAAFISSFLGGKFDSFIFNVFSDANFSYLIEEVIQNLYSKQFLSMMGIRKFLLDKKIVIKETSVEGYGEYMLPPSFIYHIYEVCNLVDFEKEGKPLPLINRDIYTNATSNIPNKHGDNKISDVSINNKSGEDGEV